MTEKLTAIVKIIRPLNFLITFVSVVVAAVICLPDKIPVLDIILAGFAASFVMASGNILNDIYDIEIDKINRALRPLPAGKITIKEAYGLYILFVIISIVNASLVNEMALVIVLFSILLLFLYSKYLKKVPLVGNITVAFLTGLVFIFGGVSVKYPMAVIIPAVFAFLINLIREIIKDMQDVEGDSEVGVITFPIQFGIKKSRLLIVIVTLLLILFTFFPFITKIYKIDFFIIVMVVVNPILVYCLKMLFENNSGKNLKKISNLLKLDMMIGLIAIYLGV